MRHDFTYLTSLPNFHLIISNMICPLARFIKFNNRFIRKILIRDNRAESSIVALYKKLELQNAMEILDSVSADFSDIPTVELLPYVAIQLFHFIFSRPMGN